MQTTIILDGKNLAHNIKQQLKKEIIYLKNKHNNFLPTLAVILLGEDSPSQIYVKNKRLACEEVGIQSLNFDLPITTTENELVKLLEQLNNDLKVHGILIQLPLPKHINTNTIIEKININKDVDGFNPYNIGRLALKNPALRPCTPKGVITLLNYYHISLTSKHVVIVGASNIVGRPLALECLLAGATVTICHHLTKNLTTHLQNADIICSAVGQLNLINSSNIKKGVIAVDIGITRDHDNKLHGDFDASAFEKAFAITPVPGGVGPMTVAMLLENTLECAKKLCTS